MASWMNTQAYYSRMILSLSVFIATIIVILYNNYGIQRTAYIKAIDVWNFIIATYALIALLQSALVTSSTMKQFVPRRTVCKFQKCCTYKYSLVLIFISIGTGKYFRHCMLLFF